MNIPLRNVIPGFLFILISISYQGCNNDSSSDIKDLDIVILNGRVIDPESRLDAIRNIGIKDGSVQLITTKEIKGQTAIDAHGLVVAPGFIDFHQHGQDQENYKYKVMDGVTTVLELEMGTADVDSWYKDREGKALINHGVSVGHVPLRMDIMHDAGGFAPVGDAAYRAASDSEIVMLKNGIEKGLGSWCSWCGIWFNVYSCCFKMGNSGNVPGCCRIKSSMCCPHALCRTGGAK